MLEVPYEKTVKEVHPAAYDFQAVNSSGPFHKRIIGWTFVLDVEGKVYTKQHYWITTDGVITSDPCTSAASAVRKLRTFVRAQHQQAAVVQHDDQGSGTS